MGTSQSSRELTADLLVQLPAPVPPHCDYSLPGCPVNSLRESSAREAILLREKEALILEQETSHRESDHRLLNGLQIVVSLLSLQSRTASDPATAAQLSIAAKRVATIERIHRRLHTNDGTQTVAFRKYLEEFCRDFSGIMDSEDPVIRVGGTEVMLPAATAIPLGFIVNELVTNAVKYGKGNIRVRLDAGPGSSYALSVSNAGPAMPEGYDPASSKGLGMKIVQSFARKIGGKLIFARDDGDQGARISILFA